MHTVPAMYLDYTRHGTGAAYTVPDLEPTDRQRAPKPRFCAPAADPEPLEIVIADPERDGAFMLTRFRRLGPNDWSASTLTAFLGWGPDEPIHRTDGEVARKVAKAGRDCVLSPTGSHDEIIRRIFTA